MDKKRKRSFVRSPTGITLVSEADLKEWEENRNSLKGKFQDFCSDTSFTPLAHVYKAGSVWKKLAWVCVSMAVTAYMGYQCSTLITKYLNYPSEVNMLLEFAPEMDFPAVTVCNLNPIRYGKLTKSKYAASFEELEDDGSDDPLFRVFARANNLAGYDDDSSASSGEVTTSDGMYNTATPDWMGETSGDNTWGEGEGWTPGTGISQTEPGSPEEGTTAGQPLNPPQTPPPIPPPNKRRKRSTLTQQITNLTAVMANMSYNQWDNLQSEVEDKFYGEVSSQHKAIEMVSDIVATMNTAQVKKMGHQKQDFIMACRWQGFPCSPRNFTHFVNYKYGNCFTINGDMDSSNSVPALKTSNAGPLYGLQLELFIEQDEYTPSVSQEAGARVVIHSRGKTPFPEDEGFSISPGYLTSVGMRKTTISRLQQPHGNCTTTFARLNSLYSDVTSVYSKQACMKSCYQEAIIAQCQCGLASYPLPANVSLCSPEKGNCTARVKGLYTKNKLGCDDSCPLPCNDEAFTLTISNAVWPGRRYKPDLYKRMLKTSTKMMRSASSGGSEYDVAKLEIFYQELNYQKIQQNAAYDFENVVSDIGGQLGLWLGVSILALGEILDFLVSVGHFIFFKAKSATQNTVRGSTPIYPYRPPKD